MKRETRSDAIRRMLKLEDRNQQARLRHRRTIERHKLAIADGEAAPPAAIALEAPAGGQLAWIRVNGRLEAQKWASDCPSTYTRKDNGCNEGYDLVAIWPLMANEMCEPVASLAARYPETTKPSEDNHAGPGASGPVVEISVPGTPSTEVDDYGQPVARALPDP